MQVHGSQSDLDENLNSQTQMDVTGYARDSTMPALMEPEEGAESQSYSRLEHALQVLLRSVQLSEQSIRATQERLENFERRIDALDTTMTEQHDEGIAPWESEVDYESYQESTRRVRSHGFAQFQRPHPREGFANHLRSAPFMHYAHPPLYSGRMERVYDSEFTARSTDQLEESELTIEDSERNFLSLMFQRTISGNVVVGRYPRANSGGAVDMNGDECDYLESNHEIRKLEQDYQADLNANGEFDHIKAIKNITGDRNLRNLDR